MKRLGFCLFAAAFLAGCVYDAGYVRYSDINGTGFQEKSEGNGVWGVAFVGGYPDFCKEAAYYRAAELTWEKGHRYFKVLAKEDRSYNDHSAGHTSALLGGEYVAGGVTYVPVYYYRIKILKEKPGSGKFVDAYHILNTHNFPRQDAPYTVAQRQKDKTQGN